MTSRHRVLVLLLTLASRALSGPVDADAYEPAGSLPTIQPPPMQGETQEIPLPGTVDEIAVGGGGRYLVFYSKALGKIGVFDVNQLKIAGYVPAGDGDAVFAAGATKLIVVSNSSSIVARYDLATQQRELAQNIDVGGAVKVALMGSASNGPAIIGTPNVHVYGMQMSIVDLETLKATPFTPDGNAASTSGNNFRISAEGNVMGMWSSLMSPTGLNSFVNVGNNWTKYNEHTSVGYIVPSPTGKYLYTVTSVYTNQLRQVIPASQDRNPQHLSIPAVHGPFALTVSTTLRGQKKESPDQFYLKVEGDDRPVARIPGLSSVAAEGEEWLGNAFTPDKRLFLIPDARLVVKLAGTKDKFIAVRFDVSKALADSEVNFLLVTSRPPLSIKAGDQLNYPITAVSKAGGVRYSLDSGPDGMRISPAGVLTWATTGKSPSSSRIIVSVSDASGQQAFHTFTLRVGGGDDGAAAAETAAAGPAEGAAKLIATTPLDIKSARSIPLPGTIHDVAVGGNGRFLLFQLRDLRKIAVFDVSQAKIVGYLPAADDDTKMVAGATRAVVLSGSQGVISRYRLDTLQREITTTMPIPDAIQFMGMGAGTEGPILLRTSKGTGQIDFATLQFLDLNTLKTIPTRWPDGHAPHAVYRDRQMIRVATNGSVYSVEGVAPFRFSGGNVQYVKEGVFRGQGGGGGLPAADGSHFLLHGRLSNANDQTIGDQATDFGVAVPSVTGRYFLSFKGPDPVRGGGGDKQSLKLYMFGDSRPLVSINDVAVSVGSNAFGSMGWEKRIFFVPEARALVTLPASNDRVELRRLDIAEALEASGVDYLVVDSYPTAPAEPGGTYTYDIQVKSKKGGVKFGLDSAPAGMTVSAEGRITWPVPADLADEKVNVVVGIGDASGQSTFHTFAIEIPKNMGKAAEAKKQAEEQKRLAEKQAEEQKRLADVTIRAQTQELQRQRAAQAAAQNAAKPPAAKPAMRVWTNVTGERTLTAKFVEILDKKTVVLQLESGEIRKVPLSRLSEADIYEAVRADLMRQGTDAAADESPF